MFVCVCLCVSVCGGGGGGGGVGRCREPVEGGIHNTTFFKVPNKEVWQWHAATWEESLHHGDTLMDTLYAHLHFHLVSHSKAGGAN